MSSIFEEHPTDTPLILPGSTDMLTTAGAAPEAPSQQAPASIFDEHPTTLSFLPNPGEAADGISAALKLSPDPLGEWARIKSSQAIATALNLTPATVYQNYDHYAAAWLGKSRPAKTNGEAIVDSWKATQIQSAIASTWSSAILETWTGMPP